ncbi:hypothetical protein NDU88_000669 [Pleurodeles waltl]|uniref:Uncharacterized protein n=1 Tax=Pleurodeles waltl TaxID=8319 RepID=A0AAV7S6B6_PLEWA|nr:hypothetical protein NDU88_000669 [Pleurodeles waltl]
MDSLTLEHSSVNAVTSPLLPLWSQAALRVHRGRSAAARLRFQGSLGRVSTGFPQPQETLFAECLASTGQPALRTQDIQAVPEYFCMNPKCPSGPGSRTRQQGQRLRQSLSSNPIVDNPEPAASSSQPLLGPGARSKRATKGSGEKMHSGVHLRVVYAWMASRSDSNQSLGFDGEAIDVVFIECLNGDSSTAGLFDVDGGYKSTLDDDSDADGEQIVALSLAVMSATILEELGALIIAEPYVKVLLDCVILRQGLRLGQKFVLQFIKSKK